MSAMKLTRPVFFVGFMGAGKTSVSRKLARITGGACVDMDTYLVRRQDMTIPEIFEKYGEDGFRDIETDVLKELAEKPDCLLISCGGGIVKRPENREILKQHGFVVFLFATADEARARINDLSSRPLFNDIESARAMVAERMPLYEEVADVTIQTGSKGVGALAYEVKAALEREGILVPAEA